MKGRTTQAFWAAYDRLPAERQQSARSAYRLWRDDPFHPSLHFKTIAGRGGLVSARIGRGWRALGVRRGDLVIWFWVGPHREYDKLIGRS